MADVADVTDNRRNAKTDSIEDFWAANKEAMSVETYKGELNRLRFDYIDEIPAEKVNSATPVPEGTLGWKVRNGWFLQVANLINAALVDGLIDEEDVKLVDQYSRFVKNIKQQTETTHDEIVFANRVLDTLLSRIK